MATDIVQQWITREMKLSKVVGSFESDFSNGYLFGEILQRYGLIDDIAGFSKKTGKDAKVANFTQVERVLRDIKVKFDGKLIHQIMNEERGAALRLLYQLKLGIEKNADIIGGVDANKRTMTNLKPDLVTKKFEETEQLKSTVLPPITGAKPTIDKSMIPFEHRKALLEKKALEDQKREEELIMSLYMETRAESKRKLDENRDFMMQWLKEGKKNWQANHQKRADAIARVKYFEDREVKAYKGKLQKDLDEATKELIGGVDEFERNLQKLGIEKNTNIEEAMKRMEEKKGVPPGQIQNFSYAATMNKIKEKKNMLDFAVKERDRRRRKMIVDQSKTQTELEKKKQEELMIEKLLKQQDEEQRLAYLERREAKCKEMIVEQRRQKALQNEEKRRSVIEDLERKRNEGMGEQIEKHLADYKDRKKDFNALRREEKAKKRSLNVEICSEVIDLIMDLANEAHDETKKYANGKITKPVWREWMRLFKDNKLVSKARKGLLNQPEEGTFVVADTASQMSEPGQDILEDSKQPIEAVLEAMKGEQCFNDMLEYLSASGIFNLTDGSYEEWGTFSKSLAEHLKSLDFSPAIFNSQNPPVNSAIGALIQQLFATPEGSSLADDKKTTELPSYLTLKLCLLGRASAGKRTVAKQLQEAYSKLKVFRMDELIREVLEYINPKPVADAAAQDKGKKPPPAKGKAEEAAPSDPFAGLDTRQYKEIGAQIKKIIGEVELTAALDLVAMINDDALLVNLFIQKLKLSFPADKSEEAKIEEIKQNLAREEKILEELAELEAANAAGGDPSKAKGAKAPPAKKGAAGGPSGEEQLRAELEQITKVQPEGWLLLDFPRSLKQAKVMEKLMTGFVASIDATDNEPQQDFELWSKLVSPVSPLGLGKEVSYNGEPYAYKSGTDAYLFLEVPADECYRRLRGRKVDPTTNAVYHIEDNPPPEGDPKLKDRLQDLPLEPEYEASRLSQNHYLYTEQSGGLKNWATSFALRDEALTEGVSALLEVQVDSRQKKEEVFELVQKAVNRVVAFKQALLDDKRAKVKQAMLEATAQSALGSESQAKLEEATTEQKPEEDGSKTEEVAGQHLQTQKSSHSKSLQSLKQAQKSGSQASLSLNDDASKRAFFKKFESDFYRESLQVFRAVRRQRDQVFDGLTQMQQNFIEQFLARLDTRQVTLIQDFIDSFNKFSEEFPNLRTDPVTQEELRKRVVRLGNDMWTLVEQKKDQALAQHAKLNTDGWVVGEIKRLMKFASRLIQLELQKFAVLVSVVSGVQSIFEIDLERTLDNFSDDGLKVVDEASGSPLFDSVLAYALSHLQRQTALVGSQLESHQQALLLPEVDGVVYRFNLIRTWVLQKAKEFNLYWTQLSEVLDDGIVVAIKLENAATQSVVRRIQEHMAEQQETGEFHPMDHSDFRIPYIDLEAEIARIDFSDQGTTQRLNLSEDPRLRLDTLKGLYEGLRFYAYEEYLEVSTFVNHIVLSLKSGAVPDTWRQIDFGAIQRMAALVAVSSQNSRDFINWKKLITMFTLLAAPLPSQEDLDMYEANLNQLVAEDGTLKLDVFDQVPAWFDDFESQVHPEEPLPVQEGQEEEEEGAKRDEGRLQALKQMLFRIHQGNTRVLRASVLIRSLRELRELALSHGCPSFHRLLFRPNQDQ